MDFILKNLCEAFFILLRKKNPQTENQCTILSAFRILAQEMIFLSSLSLALNWIQGCIK